MSDTPLPDQPEPAAEEPTPDSGEEEQPDPEAGDASAQDDGERDDTDDNPNQEAARYRRRLRETEGERDRLGAALEQYQRLEVERIASSGPDALAEGGDLWQGGADLAELVDEDGQVDPEKVRTAVAGVLSQRPHWRRPSPDLGQGVRVPASSGPDFAGLLRHDGARR